MERAAPTTAPQTRSSGAVGERGPGDGRQAHAPADSSASIFGPKNVWLLFTVLFVLIWPGAPIRRRDLAL